MTFDLKLIRSRNPIEEIVMEKFALKKSGTRYVRIEHDSLIDLPRTGSYFWNSRISVCEFFFRVRLNYLSGSASPPKSRGVRCSSHPVAATLTVLGRQHPRGRFLTN